MSWAKLDDRFHQNRKIRRVWRRYPAALGLHVMAITYSAANLTDGVVDVEFVEDQIAKDRDRDRAVTTLVEAGLWHEHPAGWEIHDYAEFNETRSEAEAKHASRSAAGKAGAEARWGVKHPSGTSDANPMAGAMADANGTAMANDAPVPTRPVPTTSSSAVADQEIKPHPEAERLCRLLAELMLANDPGAKPRPESKGWRDDMRLLIDTDGRDPATVERIVRWCQSDPFWRSNVLSPGKLRRQFPQLLLKSPAAPATVDDDEAAREARREALFAARRRQHAELNRKPDDDDKLGAA